MKPVSRITSKMSVNGTRGKEFQRLAPSAHLMFLLAGRRPAALAQLAARRERTVRRVMASMMHRGGRPWVGRFPPYPPARLPPRPSPPAKLQLRRVPERHRQRNAPRRQQRQDVSRCRDVALARGRIHADNAVLIEQIVDPKPQLRPTQVGVTAERVVDEEVG